LIPVYFKYSDQPDSNKLITYLEITTVSVEKTLIVSESEIDFGEIAVGIRETKDVYIQNLSE
jgi:hypothetical protein